MRMHPLWRGFWLAVALAASLVLMGMTDALAPFRLERRALACAGMVAVGAFLGALPGRLRRGGWAGQRTTWQKCLRAFLCGAAMALALGFAGDGRVLTELLTGSAGAYAFCLVAAVTGFATVRIMGRRRA